VVSVAGGLAVTKLILFLSVVYSRAAPVQRWHRAIAAGQQLPPTELAQIAKGAYEAPTTLGMAWSILWFANFFVQTVFLLSDTFEVRLAARA
jgi:hypothetical protein